MVLINRSVYTTHWGLAGWHSLAVYLYIIIASSYGYYLPLADQVVASCLPVHEVNAHVVVTHVYCCKYADLASRKFSDFLYVVFRNITVRIYVSHIILIICFRRYYSRHVFISKPYTNVLDFWTTLWVVFQHRTSRFTYGLAIP